MKAIHSVWKLCSFEHQEKEIRSLLVEPFVFLNHRVSFLALKAPESCLHGWQKGNKRKVLFKLTGLFFFFPAQEDSCPEVIVPGISTWTFTVRDKGILLLPFQSSQAVLKYMSAVLQLLLFFPQLHACGSSLSCDRGVIIAGGSDWSPLSHQTLFALFCKVGLERTRQELTQVPPSQTIG